MAYLNYAASSTQQREYSKSRSPLRRPWCLKSAARRQSQRTSGFQEGRQERRQSQRTSGFQVAGAPCGLAEYNEGDIPKYVCSEWNVDAWLAKLRALGCDPASLNKLVHVNKLDPKLANWILLSFYMRIADGVNSLNSFLEILPSSKILPNALNSFERSSLTRKSSLTV